MACKLAKTREQSGYTLIEVLIALAIFSIGFMAVSVMQIRSINHNASARMQTEATTLAAHWMERLILLPWDDENLSETGNPHSVQVPPYTVVWNITKADAGDPVYGGLPLKNIELTVDGDNPNARPVTVRFIKGQGL
jgi:prepilin-type N-terminal cleavage/methylation domain-containing protein